MYINELITLVCKIIPDLYQRIDITVPRKGPNHQSHVGFISFQYQANSTTVDG